MERTKSPCSSHTHLQAATSQPTAQSLQKSVPAPPKKNFKIFFSTLQKKLKQPTHKPTMRTADTYEHDNWTTEKEAHAHNKGLAKVAVQWLIEHLCFVSSAVLADSFVLRIRHLRQAPKRYRQA